MILKIEVAPGELIDKITILEIKLARMSDQEKIRNVQREYALLAGVADVVSTSLELTTLRSELKSINEMLWQIEDDIRECERRQDFGPDFIRLARAVYRTNDERARVKREINRLLNSTLVEEKAYAPY
jgi:Family of unknown function (DUF6165)